MCSVNKQAEVDGISCLKKLNCCHQRKEEVLTDAMLCKEKKDQLLYFQRVKAESKFKVTKSA